MPDHFDDRYQCTGTVKSTRKRCGNRAIEGGTVCRFHGGAAPQVAARAGIRLAVSQWTDGKATANPDQTLLRLMTVAYERAVQHADALNEILTAKGWESAFVGDSYAVDPDTANVTKTGEYARQLARWEAAERKHAADLAVKAIAANLETRRVRATEAQVAAVLDAMRQALTDAGLEDRVGEVVGNVGRHLHAVAS